MINRVICLNDKNRPNEIPLSKWIKKGELYTPIKLIKCNVQGGTHGFVLKEIELDSSCLPYECFAIERFGIPKEIMDKVLKEELETELVEI